MSTGAPRPDRQQSAFTNPVLIGAVTVLVVLIAVFLAYNANNGLPFVPTRELKVDIANGSNLVPGNDVLEGGNRIGFVSCDEARPASGRDGRRPADAEALEEPRQDPGRLDTSRSGCGRCSVRSTSTWSRAPRNQVFPDGGTLPMSQTNVPVQLDEVFNIFNPPTRTGGAAEPVGLWGHVHRARQRSEPDDSEPAVAAWASASRWPRICRRPRAS